jgi:hypothetical protein
MTLAYQHFTTVLLLIYGSIILSGVYCLRVFWCAVTSNSWILHHDNAPAHTVLPVREFLVSKKLTVLDHLPNSPDIAPSDFFLFPKVKETLKGIHFNDTEDIRRNTTAAWKSIPQNQFQNCFEG